MTNAQKNARATAKLHEAMMATLFAFAFTLLVVVLGHWAATDFAMSMSRWLNHAEALVIATAVFLAVAAFQPTDSFLQKRFTRLVQKFWGWC